jgi:hypothetical protein
MSKKDAKDRATAKLLENKLISTQEEAQIFLGDLQNQCVKPSKPLDEAIPVSVWPQLALTIALYTPVFQLITSGNKHNVDCLET